MSNNVREPGAARAAVQELEVLIVRLGDEVAAFRRRALAAEARTKALEEAVAELRERADAQTRESAVAAPLPGPASVAAGAVVSERLAALERENEALKARLEGASSRTRQMLDRLRFLRQQHSLGGPR